ncbi:MAG: S41 family peptidase [Gemmatimonadetes bacterium]|nr:MAG: S41 family peptidase [Gemmatimonadota bacterium]
MFLSAFQAIRDYGLEARSDSALWEAAIQGLVRQIGDPYATVFTPEAYDEFQEENTGSYAGIGVQITSLNDAITVTAVFRSTPAERAGVQVGDLIIGVDGESTEGWTTDDASRRIRGPVGTAVDVTFARPGVAAPIALEITRDSVHVSAVTADRIGEIGYIALDRVARSSAREIDSALVMLSDARGIVLDLRGNPGGYLDESLMMADLFLDRGLKLASLKSRTPGRAELGTQEEWHSRWAPRVPGKPIVVLVDRFSASAAEIVAGALQDHDRALILGERTFGKGIVQSDIVLTEGRHLRLTTGEWFTPLGRSLHRPRDQQGRLRPEEEGHAGTFTTAAGRTLSGDGGILPDIAIEADTLTLREREFLTAAAQAGVPLTLRIEEFAFGEAERLREAGEAPSLDEAAFQGLVDTLRQEGVPAELLADAGVLAYLRWRARVRVAERMERLGVAMRFRTERDPVLARALELLREAEDQRDLFAAAERARKEGPAERVGAEGSGRR